MNLSRKKALAINADATKHLKMVRSNLGARFHRPWSPDAWRSATGRDAGLIPLPISYKPGIVEEGIEDNGPILRREPFQNILEQIFCRMAWGFKLISVKFFFAIYSKFKNLFINGEVNGAISFAFFCVFIATYLMIRSALMDFLI